MGTIRINNKNVVSVIEVENGITLLKALSGVPDIFVDSSCGGKGTCGKCKVKVLEGVDSNLQEAEKKFLSKAEIEKGYRLACQVKIKNNIIVSFNDNHTNAQIVESHTGFKGLLDPPVKKRYLELPRPSLSDQRDDVSRVADALKLNKPEISLSVMRKLPALMHDSDFSVTVIYSPSQIISAEKGNTEKENYGIAVDIGTTTVVAYLLNLSTGTVSDTVSELNRQRFLGADVISRIEYCMKEEGGLLILQEKIRAQLGEMILSLLKKNDIPLKFVYTVMFAGNTTMLHLLAGVDPSGIATAPFIPVFLGQMNYSSYELGEFPLECMFYFMPSLSGYIGGDIVAGVLATEMDRKDDLSILIDIGTNGEIVLGNKDKLYSCSTAAGPAFEGAHISCGMGGISGAVDSFVIENNTVKYTTIEHMKPAGICGSAIIDIVAMLLKTGVVDFTGRILEENEIETELAKTFFKERVAGNGGHSFILVKASESGTGEDIVFTQKDIREVQLAKAAISAGIATLLHQSGESVDDIAHVFIAGGFGSYISKVSAAAIGLIPGELLNRTEFVGNTAGQGASACLFSKEDFARCGDIVKLTEYIELSSNAFFQGKYMEDMVFPEY